MVMVVLVLGMVLLVVDVGRSGAPVLMMLGLRDLLLVVLAMPSCRLLVVVVDGTARAHLGDRAAKGGAADRLVGRNPHSGRVGRLAPIAGRPPRLHSEVPPRDSVLGIRVKRRRGHGLQRIRLRSVREAGGLELRRGRGRRKRWGREAVVLLLLVLMVVVSVVGRLLRLQLVVAVYHGGLRVRRRVG